MTASFAREHALALSFREDPPVIEDLSTWVGTGRSGDPRIVVRDSVEAERLGLRRVWCAERYDLKEAGALMSAILAHTNRIEVGTGILAAGSRHPLITAATGATLQALYASRFNLGLGRSTAQFLQGQNLEEPSYRALGDYIGILRSLWRGETVSYDGPAGLYEALKVVDLYPGDPPITWNPPRIWVASLGGPLSCRLAARYADGVLLQPCMTAEATATAVQYVREESARLGLPDIPVVQPFLSAVDLDEVYTMEIIKGRMVGYMQLEVFRKSYARSNGWDLKLMEEIADHPMFRRMSRASVDQSFRNSELFEPAKLIPNEWVESSCAVGSVNQAVHLMQGFKDAGADELALYASKPAENAALIAAWREHRALTGGPGKT
jgi:probable F420-dependent oxidoreductase